MILHLVSLQVYYTLYSILSQYYLYCFFLLKTLEKRLCFIKNKQQKRPALLTGLFAIELSLLV